MKKGDVVLPTCCGKQMKIRLETPRFYEVECEKCKDSVYVRKNVELKPVLLDD